MLLEFVKVERLHDDAPAESLWFLELFDLDVVGNHLFSRSSEEEIAAKKHWFRAWGYLDEDQDEAVSPFNGAPGVLNWSGEDGSDHFVRQARKKTGSLFLPIEALYAAATFGVLSVDVFTTTGMRMNEILQLRLTPECFVRLHMPAPAGAKDQSPRIRYAFRLLPKGEKTETLHDYFIGEETKRLLVKVARMLADHYHLQAGEGLPTVAYSPNYPRKHRAAKFACVGCPGKVPDPAKRLQLEKHKVWAMQQVTYAAEEGLLPEAERMRQLARDCETELQEIEAIEAYRKDEKRAVQIHLEARQ